MSRSQDNAAEPFQEGDACSYELNLAKVQDGDMIEIVEMDSANVQITLFHGSSRIDQTYYQKKSYKGYANHMQGAKPVFIIAQFTNSDPSEAVYFEIKFRRVDRLFNEYPADDISSPWVCPGGCEEEGKFPLHVILMLVVAVLLLVVTVICVLAINRSIKRRNKNRIDQASKLESESLEAN